MEINKLSFAECRRGLRHDLLATFATEKDRHNTGNFTSYSFRIVCGFLNVPSGHFKHGRYCETGPTAYSPYPRKSNHLLM